MQIRRFDPFTEFDRALSAISSQTSTAVPMDVVRREDAVVVHLDLPGVDPASIDITTEGRQITLRAERTLTLTEGEDLITNERRHGSMTRVLNLSDKLDPGHVSADYRNGVLSLAVPYAETAKPRKIEVAVGAPAIDTTATEVGTTAASTDTAAASTAAANS